MAELALQDLFDDVVRLLTTESGEFPQPYQRRPRLAVNQDAGAAGLEFNLDAVLTGPGDQEGLVTVQMVSPDRLRKTRNEVRALTTWLTRTGSRRPLTLVAITEGSNDNAAPNDQLKVTQTSIRKLSSHYSASSQRYATCLRSSWTILFNRKATRQFVDNWFHSCLWSCRQRLRSESQPSKDSARTPTKPQRSRKTISTTTC